MLQRIAITTLVILGLLGSLGTASAGPIPWIWTLKVSGENGRPRLDLGSQLVDPDNDGVYDTMYATTRVANFFASGNTTSTRQENITLHGFPKYRGWELSPTPQDDLTDKRFRAVFTINDLMSGESVTFDIFGWAELQWVDNRGLVSAKGSDQYFRHELGENVYELRTHIWQNDHVNALMADVSVTPAAEAPEPGALTLAGLGLFGVAATGLRRWRARVS